MHLHLTELMGVNIFRVDALRPGYKEFIKFGRKKLSYTTWADLLMPTTAKVLATYESDAYKGVAAVTRQAHGRGSCLTIGMWVDVEGLRELLSSVLKQAKIEVVNLPEGVRVTTRANTSYLLNFNSSEVRLNLKGLPKKIAKHDVIMRRD
jgi:beta-galactosidase